MAYVQHHGILGMRWGERNGPPYPLAPSQRSAAEKRAGSKKPLTVRRRPCYTKTDPERSAQNAESRPSARAKRGLSSGQKKAIAIGLTVAAAYGAYKLGYLDDLQRAGKSAADAVLRKFSNTTLQSVGSSAFIKLPKRETVSDVLSKVNPTKSRNNCYNCVVATAARLCGWDVTAKGDTQGGRGLAFGEICKAFKLDPDNDKDVMRITHPTVEKVARQISKRFSEGDVGAIGLEWNEEYRKILKIPKSDGLGHTLNWIMRNGQVEFADGQQNITDSATRAMLHQWMSSEKEASVAKFGNLGMGLSTTIDTLFAFVNTRV